jgi:hypothetical protein
VLSPIVWADEKLALNWLSKALLSACFCCARGCVLHRTPSPRIWSVKPTGISESFVADTRKSNAHHDLCQSSILATWGGAARARRSLVVIGLPFASLRVSGEGLEPSTNGLTFRTEFDVKSLINKTVNS